MLPPGGMSVYMWDEIERRFKCAVLVQCCDVTDAPSVCWLGYVSYLRPPSSFVFVSNVGDSITCELHYYSCTAKTSTTNIAAYM